MNLGDVSDWVLFQQFLGIRCRVLDKETDFNAVVIVQTVRQLTAKHTKQNNKSR